MPDKGGNEATQTPGSADDVARARAKKLNDRAFTMAFVSLFLPFIGIVLSVAALWVAMRSRREGRALGLELSKSSTTFAIVATAVWTVLWLLILIPALL